MNPVTKKTILLDCISKPLSLTDLKGIIESGAITLDEFEEAGLDSLLLNQLKSNEEHLKSSINNESEKTKLLQQIANNEISIDDFLSDFDTNKITEEDLRNIGLSDKTVRSIKYYCSNTRESTIFKSIKDLPKMSESRTDVYFVGLPGTGKSTMLAGILYAANKDGILLTDTYCKEGAIFQTHIISELTKGVLPRATAMGSFNYIAMSLADESQKAHPFNVVEVPGESFKKIYNDDIDEEVAGFLDYINNDNRKILIFTIDSLTHNLGYDVSKSLDQTLVYVNILNILKKNGVLNKTDAIYLVVNKFDAIKESRYKNDNRLDEEIAFDFISHEFKNLMNNCKYVREELHCDFKIRIMPFSIGEVVNTSILKTYRKDYALKLINKILLDSFVVTEKSWKLFTKRNNG